MLFACPSVPANRAMRSYPARPFVVRPLVLCLAALAPACQTMAAAASRGAVFAGLQTTVVIGLGIPNAAAIDAAGNLYVTDLIDSKVYKIARGTAGANCTVTGSCTEIGSGFVQPVSVAIDASGDAFIADAATQDLYKVTSAGTQTIVATGLTGVSGVAIGTDGTAYLAVAGAIEQVSPAGVLGPFATSSTRPGGIAVDSNGTVYVADPGGGKVVAYSAAGIPIILASGLSSPQAIALDGLGNLYVSDSGTNRVLSVPVTGNGYVCPADCSLLNLQTASPSGVASDLSGHLYVADPGNQRVVKLSQDADFGVSPVVATNATPATTLTLDYQLYSSSCAAPPTVRVLTRGAANKDFTSSPAASVCTPGTPDALAVTVNFAPLSPGLRLGSVQFIDATGVPETATYLHGVGKGPLITWTPGVVTPALSSPQ